METDKCLHRLNYETFGCFVQKANADLFAAPAQTVPQTFEQKRKELTLQSLPQKMEQKRKELTLYTNSNKYPK